MLKKIVVSLALLVPFVPVQLAYTDGEYRNVHQEQLDNGISVIFIDADSSDDMVLVMFCVSCGSTDEKDKEGIANLLSKIYAKKLSESGLEYGIDINSNVGFDQSMYYVLGKKENLNAILENFAKIYLNFTVSQSELENYKNKVRQSILDKSKNDKNNIHQESMRSLYWHSKQGSSIEGTFDSLDKISRDNVLHFKENNYTDNRITIVVLGKFPHKDTLNQIKQYFSSHKKTESKIERIQEPPHHGSTVAITKYSNQIDVPMVEMYWKIPNYRNDKAAALAVEIFINAMMHNLEEELIYRQKLVASISFSYSSWNYSYGDLCISFTPLGDPDNIPAVINAVLTEMKSIATDGLKEEQINPATKKIANSNSFIGKDIFGVANLLTSRLGSGCGFDCIVNYPKDVLNCNKALVNQKGKKLFGEDPAVMSIILPERAKKN